MASELRPTEAYARNRGRLSPALAKLVAEAEGEIALDPGHRHWRRVVDGVVYDYSVADHGLLIVYRELAGDVIELVDLLDLHGGRSRRAGG